MGPVGIERLTTWPGQLCLELDRLAQARGISRDYPARALGVRERSLNPPWEDPVTMAVNAAAGVLDGQDRDAVGLIVVGTESAVDYGKPISSWVQRHCGIGSSCRNFETKHACYSGTAALMAAAHWIASGQHRGAKALVITTDESRAHFGAPWEYILGAGACAMLVSDNPLLLELELDRSGYWTDEVADTFRPAPTAEVGNADDSLFCYLDALDGAWSAFETHVGDVHFADEFAGYVYHMPFPGLAERAHRALLRRADVRAADEVRQHFEKHVAPSQTYAARTGGTYSGSTFFGLLGLLDGRSDLAPGDRVGMFAYGSGSCAEYYSARVGTAAVAGSGAHTDRLLDQRHVVDVATYEHVERARQSQAAQADVTVERHGLEAFYSGRYEGSGLLVFDGVQDYRRSYRVS